MSAHKDIEDHNNDYVMLFLTPYTVISIAQWLDTTTRNLREINIPGAADLLTAVDEFTTEAVNRIKKSQVDDVEAQIAVKELLFGEEETEG